MRILTHTFLLTSIAVATADPKQPTGAFVGPGTYATGEGCAKLKALEAGKERSGETVPETLNVEGFQTWEGGCTFASVKETEKGRTWMARMLCGEELESSSQIDIFTRNGDGSWDVRVGGEPKPTHYVRCDAAAGK